MKQPEEYALEYAGFWLRFAAGILDAIFLFLLLFFVNSIFSDYICDISASLLTMFAGGVISFLITFVYHVSFWAWKGQTAGKLITGVKIIRTDSSPLDGKHAVIRFLSYVVSALPLMLGFIWIAFDHKKQGFHDKIADTYVVKLPVRQVVFTHHYVRGRVG